MKGKTVIVSELITLLSELPQGAEVILAKDPEGNGYSPLAAVDGSGIYVPESTYSGDVLSDKWTAEEAGFGPDEWDRFKSENKRCVVLGPVN